MINLINKRSHGIKSLVFLVILLQNTVYINSIVVWHSTFQFHELIYTTLNVHKIITITSVNENPADSIPLNVCVYVFMSIK